MIPSRPIQFPQGNPQAPLAQLRAAGQNTVSPTTQGLPQVVTNVSVNKLNLSSTRVRLTVSFNQNPSDPYFTNALLYLRLGNAQPTLVGQGNNSPLTVTVDRTSQPASIVVASAGNWGATDVSNSPSIGISLN